MLTEIIQIGTKPIRMCINCGACKRNDGAGCTFRDDLCAVITEKMKECDALIVGLQSITDSPTAASSL